MTRILWKSPHPPLPCHLRALGRRFRSPRVVHDPARFASAAETARIYREGRFDAIVVVSVPTAAITQLRALGIVVVGPLLTAEELTPELRARANRLSPVDELGTSRSLAPPYAVSHNMMAQCLRSLRQEELVELVGAGGGARWVRGGPRAETTDELALRRLLEMIVPMNPSERLPTAEQLAAAIGVERVESVRKALRSTRDRYGLIVSVHHQRRYWIRTDTKAPPGLVAKLTGLQEGE